MPTYSYRCTQCGHAFDIHQAFTDDTLTVCPNCAGTLRKIFSPVGVSFTGSGFYRNDSRAPAKPEKTESTSDSKTETKADSKSETKSDTKATAEPKPASKSESKPKSKS